MVDQLSASLPFQGQRLQDMPDVGTLKSNYLFYVEAGLSAGSQRKITFQALRDQLMAGTSLNLTKASIGLGSVDNTADINKPVSGPQKTALDKKADVGHSHDGADIKTGNIAAERMQNALSKALDLMASLQPGDMLYRGAQGMVRVPAGQSGQFLQSQGRDAPPVWTTISVNNSTASAPLNVVAPTISGNAIEGQTLVANDGTWSGNPVPTFTRVWKRNGTAIPGATGPTYVLAAADVGAAISITVTGSNVVGNSSATSVGLSVVAAPRAPQNIVAPSISGAPTRGQILTANDGQWTGNPAPQLSYQWRRNGSVISGATSPNYTLVLADVGAVITLAVTATNSSGSVTVLSSGTAAISDATTAPTNATLPSITGSPVQGSVLTASDGTWNGNPVPVLTRQWKRGGVAINGATGATYTLAVADVGSVITVEVTATSSAGTAKATSAGTAVVTAQTAAPSNTVAPSITGNPVQGQTLTAVNGTWVGTPAPTFTLQWKRNGVAISGAVGQTYLVGPSDVGAQITVTVTATNSAGVQSATSNPTLTVTAPGTAPANTALPSITGTTQSGSVLTAVPGTWTGNPAPTFSYQWRRGGVDIAGANAATYTLVGADVGSAISVLITGTNASGSASALSSSTAVVTADLTIAPQLVQDVTITGSAEEGATVSYTPAVWSETAVPPTNNVKPSISGAYFVGQTLTANDGTWVGTAPLTLTRQWKRNGAPISGETGATYVLAQADQGTAITVTVTGTSPYGVTNATSNPTSAIAAPAAIPVNTAIPIITGTATQGQTLSAANPGNGAIDPSNLGTTAAIAFDENWNNIDFRTAGNSSGRWATGYHWYPPEGGSLNGTMEQQWYIQKDYQPQAVLTPPWTVSNGILSLTAYKTPADKLSLTNNYAYYSGMLTTYYSHSQARGYWEARIKMPPGGNGFFPAFWLLPDDGGWPPEIDIMEWLSNAPNAYYATTHWAADNQQLGGAYDTGVDLSAAFHTYGVRIDDTKVTYFFDGVQIRQHDMQTDMVGRKWYTLLNLAIGGWNGNVPNAQTVFPASMQIDYFRVYSPVALGAGAWQNNPTSYQYQWRRDGVDIPGANGITYTLTGADVGKQITVRVVAVNGAGSSAPATSSPTAAVASNLPPAPANTALPTITGTAQVGQTLTGADGSWSNSPTSYARQWKKNGVNISGATGSTYQPVVGDIGATITFVVTASNAGGASSPATSAATSAVIAAAAGGGSPMRWYGPRSNADNSNFSEDGKRLIIGSQSSLRVMTDIGIDQDKTYLEVYCNKYTDGDGFRMKMGFTDPYDTDHWAPIGADGADYPPPAGQNPGFGWQSRDGGDAGISGDAYPSVSGIPFPTTGQTARWAIDRVANLVWIANGNGNWNNNPAANPATGVGGVKLGNGQLNFLMHIGHDGQTDPATSWTIRSRSADWLFAAPSGFVQTTGPTESPGFLWNPLETLNDLHQLLPNMRTLKGGDGTKGRARKPITGKRYFEVESPNRDGDLYMGFSNAADIEDPYNAPGQNGASVGWQSWGAIMSGWSDISPNNIPMQGTGQVSRWAVDEVARKFWLAVGTGNWNGDASANPATGVGGLNLPASPYELRFHARWGSGTDADSIVLRTRTGDFTMTPPTGFTEQS